MKVLGRDLILSINNTNLACAKSCDLSLNTDFIEVCAPDGGEWEDYIPSTNSWGCSASALSTTMEYFDQLEQIWHDRTMITLRMYDTKMGCFYKGNAYIKKLTVVGNDKGLVTMSVTFQPKGELLKATKEYINQAFWQAYFYRNRQLFFSLTGRDYAYLQTNDDNNKMVFYNEVTFTKKARVYISNAIVVVKAREGAVERWLSDAESLNEATIAFNAAAVMYAAPDKGCDKVLEPGTYTFISDLGSYYSGGFYMQAI